VRSALLVLVTSLLAVSPLAAQPGAERAPGGAEPPLEPSLDELSLGQLLDAKIITASRVAEKASEAPATVYVITKQDIRARGYSTLADVLKDLPGMETVEQYYSEQGTLVPVRGVVGNNKIVLLVNGMRVNPPGGEELMIRNDVSVRFAEQIEVIYGPGSTLYGQDAISAVINIRTRSPSDLQADVLGGYGNNRSGEGFAGFGWKWREHTDTPLSVSGYVSYRTSRLDDFSKSYSAWWQKYEDYLSPLGRGGPPTRGDFGLNVFGRVESKNASLQAWYRQSARSSSEGSGEGGASPVLFFVPEAKWRDQALVVEGQHALQLADRVALHSILVFNRYEAGTDSRYIFPNGAGDLFLTDFKYAIGTSTSLEEKLDVEVGTSTRLMFGVVGTSYDVIPKTSVPGGAHPTGDIVSQAGSVVYYTEANNPASRVELHRAVDLHYRQGGVYAEAAQRLHDKVRFIAGVRVDANSRFKEIPVSPRAAIVYNALDRLTLKYIFSMAYVAPAPAFAYNIFDNGVQISSGNASLKPERALANEVNLTWKTDDLLISASGYLNFQSDLLLISQSEAPGTVIANVFVNPDGTGPRRLTQSINLGSGHSAGLDLSSRYNIGPVATWASYSFVDVKRNIAGVTSGLSQISAHNVRAGLTWNILPNLSFTPSLVLRSTPANLTATYAIPGVKLSTPYEVNVNVLYSPIERFDVYLTIRNVTNNHYALRGISGPAQQEPIWGMAGLRFRY
jgi:outer membrane receptor protein involved in Fe transport